MAKRSKRPSGGLSPGKAVLIGILSVVLLLAIVAQFGRKKQLVAEGPTATSPASVSSESTNSSTRTAPTTVSKRPARSWPNNINLAEIVASNPFELPEVLRPRREAVRTLTPSSEPGEAEANIAAAVPAGVREMRRRQADFMASLRAKGVDMILRSPRGSVARIGDLSLRVGDVHEGLRVEAIGQNGVVFAPAVVADGQLE